MSDELRDELRNSFEHQNAQFHKERAMGYRSAELRIIKTWKAETLNGTPWMTFPRGGLSRVRGILSRHGGMVARDMREAGQEIEWPETEPMSLWPFQEEAAEACIAKQNCILRAPTGSGKTRCGFGMVGKLKTPTLVVVTDGGLFRQWLTRAVDEFGLHPKHVGQIRGKKIDLKPLTIGMSKTLAKGMPPNVLSYFGAVMFDEVHRAAARTMFDAVDQFPAKYRIGISADESRKDKKEFLIYDLFGNVASDIPLQKLIDEKYVMDVEIRVVPTDFRADWYGAPEPISEQIAFDIQEDTTESEEKEINFDRLLAEMAADEERNQLIYAVVKQEVKDGQQVVVMTWRREHCLHLDQQLAARKVRTGFLIGGDDYKNAFIATSDGLNSGRLRAAVGTYQAAGTGLDFPGMGVVAATTPIAGNRQFFGQVRGRACRAKQGKTNARLYYFWDRHVYGIAHLRNLIRWNRKVLVLRDGEWVEAMRYLKR